MDGIGIPHRLRHRLGRCAALATGGAAMVLTLGASAAPGALAAHPEAVTNDPGNLYGVAAVSASDAWAVGQNGGAGDLILHWNGRTWTKAAVPGAAAGNTAAVSAPAANDAWAVGVTGTAAADKTLVLHWNGTRWSVLPSPNPAPGGGGPLYAVSALSATDAWAAGVDGAQRSLVLHWDGTTWSRVASPDPGGTGTSSFTKLYSVTALSPSDAWAVGWYGKDLGNQEPGKTLILRWNGKTWTRT